MSSVSSSEYFPGQRWISESEPELGLGRIEGTDGQMVTVAFPAAGETRRYARASAPLRRVQFHAGDRVGGDEITGVEQRDGLYYYHTANGVLSEMDLPSAMSFSKPDDRLRAGRVDEDVLFKLRLEALLRRAKMRQSPARGFTGARVDLLPHQMSIAAEVSGRLQPRVLLADEVGLGKTIEAGLILHRLHLTGRAARVLVLVPEPLVHQWFVELLRRFHLKFALYDDARCEGAAGNPFLETQLVLCGIDWLTSAMDEDSEQPRAAQAIDAGWDLLIVDEAHHLEWTASGSGPRYQLVERLAAATPGVLLLTATPQQLGPEGHFARLRLLDPERYPSLEKFVAESAHYESVAAVLRRLDEGKPLRKDEAALFAGKSPRLETLAAAAQGGSNEARAALSSALLDAFGPGRVMFRNSRRALQGFPRRRVHIDADDEAPHWLAALLRRLNDAKVLVICHSQERAEWLQQALRECIEVDAGVFHEGLSLLQRDRNAAWFAAEDGARVLICSEIGSEGRNFQFAHHLVLFDLPENPELLEQRIGRLDRIGQTSTIHIHVPVEPGSRDAVLARWYHEGLGAFEKTLHGAAEIAAAVAEDLRTALEADAVAQPAAVDALIEKTRARRTALEKRLARGYDVLLERNSCRPEVAESVIVPVREADSDGKFEAFVLRLLDCVGVQIEEHSERSYILRPGDLQTDALPEITEEGLSATFDRARALAREDMAFLTMDHPVVRAALDWLLGGEKGNAAWVTWPQGGGQALLLEAVFVLEAIAPPVLHVDRFLPPAVVRVVVDHTLADATADRALLKARMEPGETHVIAAPGAARDQLLPAMLDKARALAHGKARALIATAQQAAKDKLQAEAGRLTALGELNDHISTADIAALHSQREALTDAIGGAQLRLDAVRLIRRT